MVGYDVIFECLASVVAAALPIAVASALVNICVRTFMTAAFGGKMVI